MIHYTCDLCGRTLRADQDTRYEVKVEVYAAYDPMEVTSDDLGKDPAGEIEDLLGQMKDMDAEELEGQVYKSFRYDLCPECQAAFLKDPLGKAMRQRTRFEHN
ncbi:MAG: hypothetical protein FJ288_14060 [Planctomycetes bacterium]|nr:hypothetical protein [Planctomycetota bacterium]